MVLTGLFPNSQILGIEKLEKLSEDVLVVGSAMRGGIAFYTFVGLRTGIPKTSTLKVIIVTF